LHTEGQKIRARGFEMRVPRNRVSRRGERADHEPLRRAALVNRQNVRKAKNFAHHRVKSFEAGTSRVGLIAFQERAPLFGAHGRGAAVGQEINENLVRIEMEKIEMGPRKRPFALFARGPANRFDGLDAEGFDRREQGCGVQDPPRGRHPR